MVSQTRARRAAAVLMIQSWYRAQFFRKRILPALKTVATREKRAALLERAAKIAETVSTFKTTPCGRRHSTAEEAKRCPCFHGTRDKRRKESVFGGTYAFCSKFEWLTNATNYKTRICFGTCGNREMNGGVCPFAHGEDELLPQLPRGEKFETQGEYEMHVAQHLLRKAGIPLFVEEPAARPVSPVLAKIPAREVVDTDKVCIICFEASVEVALRDCGHCQLCVSCSKLVTECPTCRVPLSSSPLKVFF